MNNFISLGKGQLKGFMKAQFNLLQQRIGHKRPKLFHVFLFSVIILLLLQKEVSLNFNINSQQQQIASSETMPIVKSTFVGNTTGMSVENPVKEETSSIEKATAYIGNGLMSLGEKLSPASQTEQPKKPSDDNLSNTYSNMTYHEKEQPTTLSLATNVSSKSNNSKNERRLLKRKKQDNYVNRFHKVAQSEMRKYGIPASITLAQGLIESNAGDSRLSKRNNNHFGMKCFSKRCSKGHCSNFTDDSHKDFFRKYETVWESFRAHSLLLTGKRYRRLFKLQQTDYKGWATGLKKAGYATDPKYAHKLIHIIEELNLDQYDNL